MQENYEGEEKKKRYYTHSNVTNDANEQQPMLVQHLKNLGSALSIDLTNPLVSFLSNIANKYYSIDIGHGHSPFRYPFHCTVIGIQVVL